MKGFISHLSITSLRNLFSVTLEPIAGFNLFFGENGSGKTSVLEAVYLLGFGKSFRQSHHSAVINFDSNAYTIFARLTAKDSNDRLFGIERARDGNAKIKLDGESMRSMMDIIELLPMQLINPDSHELILGSPKLRRQFLDWGVFHVEQQFLPVWQQVQKTLQQRNAALKRGLPRAEVMLWDKEYVSSSLVIEDFRQKYLVELQAVFNVIVKKLLNFNELNLIYEKSHGEQDLAQLLERNFFRDLQLGYTYYGPHRSDLLIKVDDRLAKDVLSRGEQKLVVIALRLAQGMLLKKMTDKKCIYLIDDLAAELDVNHKHQLAEILLTLDSQVFVTAIEKHDLHMLTELTNTKLFHVEQGKIRVE